jgi:hypothetical protein
MAFFAQGLDAQTSAKMEAETAERNRLNDIIKAIQAHQQTMLTQLGIYQRAHGYALTHPAQAKVAAQAKARLLEAFREQGMLFKQILEIDDRRAIEKQ